MRVKALWPYALVVIVAVALDQWVKQLVEAGLAMHRPVALLPFLALFRTHNNGIAFSLLSGLGDKGLIIVALAVILLVLFLAMRSTPGQVFARTGFALIIGGALGNVVDRIRLGYVVDYVLFHTPVWSFAIFNLADALITVGAGLILLEEIVAWLRERNRTNGSKPPVER
jgi:signal peptidase II